MNTSPTSISFTLNQSIDCARFELFYQLALSAQPASLGSFTHPRHAQGEMLKIQYYFYHLLRMIAPFIIKYFPVREILFNVSPDIESNRVMMTTLNMLGSVIDNTNQTLEKMSDLHNHNINCDHLLIYNVDNDRLLKSLAARTSLHGNRTVYCKQYATGFDTKTRTFSNPRIMLTIDELTDFLIANQINEVITLNQYYAESCIGINIYLPAILNWMGVKFTGIDLDDYTISETGYIQKYVFSLGLNQKLACSRHMQKPWDDLLSVKNVLYCPVYAELPATQVLPKLNREFTTLMMTNARLPNILAHFTTTLHILEQFDDNQLFDEFQIIYFALRQLILDDPTSSLEDKLKYSCVCSQLYISLYSILKFEIIDQLRDRIPFVLYGDDVWKDFFPDIFKGLLRHDEAESMLGSGDYLYLTANQNYSYYESNPVLTHALKWNAPMLCYAPVTRHKELSGLTNIEYHSVPSLLNKIQSAPHTFASEDFQTSWAHLHVSTRAANQEFERFMFDHSQSMSLYSNLISSGDTQLDQAILNYMHKKGHVAHDVYSIIKGKQFNVRLDHLRWFAKPFVQKMYALAVN